MSIVNCGLRLEIGDEPQKDVGVRIYWIMGNTHPRMWTTGSKLRTCIIDTDRRRYVCTCIVPIDPESRGET